MPNKIEILMLCNIRNQSKQNRAINANIGGRKRGWASQVTLVKNLPANSGDVGSIPGSGISPGGGNVNPLQYSCLGNPMDRGT